MSLKSELRKLNREAQSSIYSIVKPYHEIAKLYQQNTLLKLSLDRRTKLDDARGSSSDSPSAGVPRVNQRYDDVRLVYHMNGTIKRCVMALREEVFRNGYALEPRYKVKCAVCGQEYQHRPEDGDCDNMLEQNGVQVECRGELNDPDANQKKTAEEFFQCVNANRQTLEQVLKELEDDVNIHDDAWLLIRQDYNVSMTGDIVGSQIRELIRGSPKYMQFVHRADGVLGGKWGQCLVHRDHIQDLNQGTCDVCGRHLHDVIAIAVDSGGTQSAPMAYYIQEEVVHFSKYSPSLLYGYSPILTLWDTAVALIKMVEYIYTSYDKKRIPSGIVAAKTRNLSSLREWWRAEMEQLKKDRDHIPIIGVDPDGTGGLEFVKFIDSIAEMQFKEVRDEFKREIGAVYGVEPFFMNDMSQGGGLNNEGLQLTVTNRAVAAAQRIYNNIVLPRVMKALGIKDWKLELESSEEKDDAHELDLRLKEVQVAQGMATLGFDVDMDDEEKFKYTKRDSSLQIQTPTVPTDAGFSGQPDILGRMEKTEDMRLTKGIWDMALNAMEAGALWGTYETVPASQQKFVHKLLLTSFIKGPKNYDVLALVKQIVLRTGTTKEEAERIVRTEEQAVVNKSRELYWKQEDPSGENVYRWQGPGDKRTTKICAAIKQRTKEGVKLEEMLKIIEEEATNPENLDGKASFIKTRPYTPHINCRHAFTRLVR